MEGSRPDRGSMVDQIAGLDLPDLDRLRRAVGAPEDPRLRDGYDPHTAFLEWMRDDESSGRIVAVARHLHELQESSLQKQAETATVEPPSEPASTSVGRSPGARPPPRPGQAPPVSPGEIQRFLEGLGSEVVEALESLVIVAAAHPPDSTLLLVAILRKAEGSTAVNSAEIVLAALGEQKDPGMRVEELLDLGARYGIRELPRRHAGLHAFETGLGTVGYPAEGEEQVEAVVRSEEIRTALAVARDLASSHPYSGGEVWNHHLLAALLSRALWPPDLHRGLAELGFDLEPVRRALLEYVVSSYGARKSPDWLAAWEHHLGALDSEWPVPEDTAGSSAQPAVAAGFAKGSRSGWPGIVQSASSPAPSSRGSHAGRDRSGNGICRISGGVHRRPATRRH